MLYLVAAKLWTRCASFRPDGGSLHIALVVHWLLAPNGNPAHIRPRSSECIAPGANDQRDLMESAPWALSLRPHLRRARDAACSRKCRCCRHTSAQLRSRRSAARAGANHLCEGTHHFVRHAHSCPNRPFADSTPGTGTCAPGSVQDPCPPAAAPAAGVWGRARPLDSYLRTRVDVWTRSPEEFGTGMFT